MMPKEEPAAGHDKRLRLAAIIKARPYHRARDKGPRRDLLPRIAVRKAPGHDLIIIRIEKALLLRSVTYSSRVITVEVSSELKTGLAGYSCVISIEVAIDIVKTRHIRRLRGVDRIHHRITLRRGNRAGGIQVLDRALMRRTIS